ncbi:MAG: hypothetical protein PHE83_18265 [Opitutaceae bacterium]|nr:hypothetical protein [Opitutaceae bacterium]
MATLNLQIAVGADDGEYAVSPNSYFDSADTVAFVGNAGGGLASWLRFTGVSGLSGQSIVSAVLTIYGHAADVGTPLTKIRAERAAAPANPSSQADAEGRTKTTAKVDWDSPGFSAGAAKTKDITAVIQELADNHDPSVIIIYWEDDGSSAGNYAQGRFRDHSGATYAAKLDISTSTTHTAAIALSAAVTLSPVAGLLFTPGATLAAAATLSPLATGEVFAAAALPATGTLAADGNIGTLLAASALAGSGVLAALAAPLVKTAAAALAASALLTASATRIGPIKTVSLGAGFTSSLRQHGGIAF